MKSILISLLLLSIWGRTTAQQNASLMIVHPKDSGHIFLNKSDLIWKEAPLIMPRGALYTILDGDPAKIGMFTLRFSFPANYWIPPYWKPTAERITVIEGNLYIGIGAQFDENKAFQIKPGGFIFLPPEYRHYVFTREKCVVQVNGLGPFSLFYLNAKDNPGNR